MRKITNKKMILIMSVIFIFAMLVGCSKDVKTDLSPSDHLTESIENTFGSASFDLTADMTLDMDYDTLTVEFEDLGVSKELFELINNFSASIDYKLKADRQAKSIDYMLDYDIQYKSLSLLTMSLLLNNEEIGIGFNNFYDKYFVLDFDFILAQIAAEEGMESFSQIDYEPYLEIIFNSESETYKKLAESKVYSDIIKNHLASKLSEGTNEEITYQANGEDVTEHVLTYSYDFSFEAYMGLLFELLEAAKTDEDMKAYVEVMVNDILKQVIESKDYELLGLTEEDVVQAQLVFESEFDSLWDEFLVEYEYMIEGMKSEMSYMTDDMQMIEEIYSSADIKVSINKDSIIRKITLDLDYKGIGLGVGYTVNNVGENVVIDSHEDKYISIFDYVDLENLEELKNIEELATYIKEGALSVINELMTGEAYSTLLADLEPFEEELGFELSTISLTLGLAKAEVEKMEIEEIAMQLQESYQYEIGAYDYDDYDDYDYSEDIVELETLDNIALIALDAVESSKTSDAMWNAVGTAAQNYQVTPNYILTDIDSASVDFENAIMNGNDIIFVQGSELNELIGYYSDIYPLVQFISLDSAPEYYFDNVIQIEYYNEESAYIAGAIAASYSETGKIAFVGGQEDIYTRNFEIAYVDGAVSINPDIYVEKIYTGTTDNIDIASDVIKSIEDGNIDVVYHAAGKLGEAVMDGATTFKVIGNGSRHGELSEAYLTSTLINYDYLVDYIVTDYTYGYMNTYYSFGAYDALYLEDGHLSDELINLRDTLVEQISSGDLYIPTYYGE